MDKVLPLVPKEAAKVWELSAASRFTVPCCGTLCSTSK
jgi:hypothetical protein